MSCCPGVFYFARGNKIPLPNVRRHLGYCARNTKNELHVNDDFIDLKLSTSIIPTYSKVFKIFFFVFDVENSIKYKTVWKYKKLESKIYRIQLLCSGGEGRFTRRLAAETLRSELWRNANLPISFVVSKIVSNLFRYISDWRPNVRFYTQESAFNFVSRKMRNFSEESASI